MSERGGRDELVEMVVGASRKDLAGRALQGMQGVGATVPEALMGALMAAATIAQGSRDTLGFGGFLAAADAAWRVVTDAVVAVKVEGIVEREMGRERERGEGKEEVEE